MKAKAKSIERWKAREDYDAMIAIRPVEKAGGKYTNLTESRSTTKKPAGDNIFSGLKNLMGDNREPSE